jgi:hypothetical protein
VYVLEKDDDDVDVTTTLDIKKNSTVCVVVKIDEREEVLAAQVTNIPLKNEQPEEKNDWLIEIMWLETKEKEMLPIRYTSSICFYCGGVKQSKGNEIIMCDCGFETHKKCVYPTVRKTSQFKCKYCNVANI